MSDKLPELFGDSETDLSDLKAAGWDIYSSSGGGWWFKNDETGENAFVPDWVHELIEKGRQRGMEHVRWETQLAMKTLGIQIKPQRKKKAKS